MRTRGLMISCCHLNRLPLRRPYSLRIFAANKSVPPSVATPLVTPAARIARNGTERGNPRQGHRWNDHRLVTMLHLTTSAAAHAPGMLAP